MASFTISGFLAVCCIFASVHYAKSQREAAIHILNVQGGRYVVGERNETVTATGVPGGGKYCI